MKKEEELRDINATLTINGIEDSLDTSFEKMTSSDNYEGKVTMSLTFPWGLRKDKAAYRKSLLEKKLALQVLFETEQKIILEVRSAIRNLSALEKKYTASLISKKLHQEKLLAEEKKFRHGLSTSYTVLQHQRDLSNATVNSIDALVAYQKALTKLHQIVGVPVN